MSCLVRNAAQLRQTVRCVSESVLVFNEQYLYPIIISEFCWAQDNPTPADVDAHPRGASAFGVQDLVGNIWQYTSEFQVRRHLCPHAGGIILGALARLYRVLCCHLGCPHSRGGVARWLALPAGCIQRVEMVLSTGTAAIAAWEIPLV